MIEYKETQYTMMYKSNSDLSLYSSGFEKCNAGHSYGPIIRSYHVIHFVLSGEGEFRINEHVFHLKAGDTFLIPAGKIAYYESSITNPWTYTWINFLGINSEMYLYQIMTHIEDVYVIHGLDTEKYYHSIQQIMKLKYTTTSQYFEGNSILFHIMALLFEDIHFEKNIWQNTSIIDEIKFYIDINYAENLKLKEIAAHFGIHQNYLTRSFHDKFGISPKKYLTNLKLKKAARLLSTTELSIFIIASSLGFDDQLAFSKIFKTCYNLSPSEYRKKQKGTNTGHTI